MAINGKRHLNVPFYLKKRSADAFCLHCSEGNPYCAATVR